MTSAVVEIAAVEPRSSRVRGAEVREGDFVFDVTGGLHVVKRVRVLKDGSAKIVRADGWSIVIEPIETITVVRSWELS